MRSWATCRNKCLRLLFHEHSYCWRNRFSYYLFNPVCLTCFYHTQVMTLKIVLISLTWKEIIPWPEAVKLHHNVCLIFALQLKSSEAKQKNEWYSLEWHTCLFEFCFSLFILKLDSLSALHEKTHWTFITMSSLVFYKRNVSQSGLEWCEGEWRNNKFTFLAEIVKWVFAIQMYYQYKCVASANKLKHVSGQLRRKCHH